MNTQDIERTLTNYIRKNIIKRDEVEVLHFYKPSGGWSDEAFILSLRWPEKNETKTQGFVVRKANEKGLMAEDKDLYPQFKLLDVLSRETYLPIPKVYCYEDNVDILGNEFFIMEKLEGDSFVPWSKEGRKFFEQAVKSDRIPEQFVTYLAELHNLDYQAFNITEAIEANRSLSYVDQKIKKLEELYLNYKFNDEPIVTDALEWLKQNKPEPVALSIIHNDYRTGNLLYLNDHITGILDWESAEIGDPRMDLAYVCAKANRMDSPLLSYLIDRDRFFSMYEQKTNATFTESEIFYFEVYHQLKFLMISLSAASAFVREGSDDLRMARQGFRLTLMKNMLAELLGY